jgi:carbamoyltransferase
MNLEQSGAKYILGISCYFHDSAAALIKNGEILFAAQEERFSRLRNDASFPTKAIEHCLAEAGIGPDNLEVLVFYDKPFLKFERIFETYVQFAPLGYLSFLKSMPIWLKEKLFLKSTLKTELQKKLKWEKNKIPKILFSEHHLSHAASAFYPSPFSSAAVLCLDGVGEWATTSLWKGADRDLQPIWEIHFPHSLGLLYSAFTSYLGFRVNSGEYKMMGLAPFGEPTYAQKIYDHIIELKEDGSFRLNLEYFDFMVGNSMTTAKFHDLFGGEPRNPESEILPRHMDIARSIQLVTEEVILRLAKSIQKETGEKNLCLAGGVALNCVANGKLQESGLFENIWIQPAAGDAGGALGAALITWHQRFSGNRRIGDSMKGAYLGPKYSREDIYKTLLSNGLEFEELQETEFLKRVIDFLVEGKVVGWFQGRMEFGPRALGARSILADPRNPKMQSILNQKIKKREGFRPFAPAITREDVAKFFEIGVESPYMQMVSKVKENWLVKEGNSSDSSLRRIHQVRSKIPAVTHLDNSARIQTVDSATNPLFHRLLKGFEEKTGFPILINTSFNVRGEPIVCSPYDAINCFHHTEIDILAMENFLVKKSKNWNHIHNVDRARD